MTGDQFHQILATLLFRRLRAALPGNEMTRYGGLPAGRPRG